MSPDVLYGPRATIWLRFPECKTKGEAITIINEVYPVVVEDVPFFTSTNERNMSGHPNNTRNLLSAQRKYCERVKNFSYDRTQRGQPRGIKTPDGKVLLIGGKQLCLAIYMAIAQAPANANVVKALLGGYSVGIMPANLPIDVIDFLIGFLNVNNRGIKDSISQQIATVPRALADFKQYLDSKHQTRASMPTGGDYSYHKILKRHIKEKHNKVYRVFQQFKDSKQIFNNLRRFPMSLANVVTAEEAPLMNDDELDRLILSNYENDAQTLTSDTESNLLKVRELMGLLTDEEKQRWESIKRTFSQNVKLMGVEADDKIGQVVMQMGSFTDGLHAIRDAMMEGVQQMSEQEPVEEAEPDEVAQRLSDLKSGLELIGTRISEAVDKLGQTPTPAALQPTPQPAVDGATSAKAADAMQSLADELRALTVAAVPTSLFAAAVSTASLPSAVSFFPVSLAAAVDGFFATRVTPR